MRTEERSLQVRFYERVEAAPEGRALAFYGGDDTFIWRSAAELMGQGRRAAAGLRELGVEPGDVCVLVVDNDEFGVTAVLGALLCGAVPMLAASPLIQGTNSSLASILYDVIDRTCPRAVVAPEATADLFAEFSDRYPEIALALGPSAPFEIPAEDEPLHRPASNDIAALQLTSGTTGFPRICVWKQEGVLAAIDGMADAMNVGSETVYLNWTPLYHDMGLVNNLFLCLAHGVPLVMMSPFDFVGQPGLWLRALSKTGANVTWSPNFGFALATKHIRNDQISGVRLDHVAGFWNAAERIHYRTMLDFHERFAPWGVRRESLKTNFGCAENIGGATFSEPDGRFVVEFVDPVALREERTARVVGGAKPGADGNFVPIVSTGRPHSGIQVHIVGADGADLPDGCTGEIALETPSRMVEYFGDPEATNAVVVGPLLKTGDLGYKRGKELFWTGRVRERIAIRGQKLDPSDFESVLLAVSGLREGCFAAFGIDDATLGTQRVVIVSEVREPTARPVDEIVLAIKADVYERLGVAVEVVLVRSGTLAKTSSGKRRHTYFRQLYEDGRLQPFRIDLAGPAERT